MAKTSKPKLARVIRDARDATKDYYIPESEAARLYQLGKLCLMNVYSDTWSYAHG